MSISRPKFYALLISLFTIVAILGGYFLMQHHPKRYAIFAGYNADGKVSPYIIKWLENLNKVTDGVIYITDSPLSEEEQKKVAPYIIHGEYIRHGEYDWGSYKRGFNWLRHNGYLEKADEIIFANDSTYAPITSFKPMFKAMSKRKELDFWGNTQNTRFANHLQSYFLVFRSPVIRSKSFLSFINNIQKQKHHSLYITEYEIPLTPLLKSLGFKWDSYIPLTTQDLKYQDPNSYPITTITKHKSQFLKRRTFTEKLTIEENISDLLKWLNVNSPDIYGFIKKEFPQKFNQFQP